MSLYRAKHVHGKRRVYALVTPPATPSSPSQNGVADEEAAICDERARRQAVTYLGPSRHTDEQSRIETCERYLQDNPRAIETGLCLSTAGGASNSATQHGTSGLLPGLERRTLPFFQPTSRHDLVDCQQNCARGSQRDLDSPRLAELNLVSGRTGNVRQLGKLPNDGRRQPLRSQVDQEQLETGGGCNQGTNQGVESSPDGPRTRLRLRLRLRRSASPPAHETRHTHVKPGRRRSQGSVLELRIRHHLQQTIGDGPEARGATRLLSNRPISKIMSRKATQLASFDRFMHSHRLSYPATGIHLACWIGEIYENRLRGTGPGISSTSLSGYLSGIRTSLVALGHPRLPFLFECFALREVYNAYHTWESSWSQHHGKLSNIRIAVPADAIEAMMIKVLSCYDKVHLRDLAIVVVVD